MGRFPLSSFSQRQVTMRDERDRGSWWGLFPSNNYCCWWCTVRRVLFPHQRRSSEPLALRMSVSVSVNPLRGGGNGREARVFWWSVIMLMNDLLMITAMSFIRWEHFSSGAAARARPHCEVGGELKRAGQHDPLLFRRSRHHYVWSEGGSERRNFLRP